MTVHSSIGASSMYRWSACPGSVRLSAGIKSVSSSYAEEGTRAHELAAKILTEQKFPEEGAIDPELREAVLTYVRTVLDDAGLRDVLVEQRFDLSEIYPGLFGTADAVVYFEDEKLLRVYDYKHGAGILVEVENNPQLMYYGLGALLQTKHPVSEVELVIVQPRANHADGVVRRWRFKSYNLVEFAADLAHFAERTSKKDAPLVSGDHCRFCPAAAVCPELSQKALIVAQSEFSPTRSYDPSALSETLKKLDLLEGYAKSVREFAYAEALAGKTPPGFKLVAKRAVRKWLFPDDETVKNLKNKFSLKDSDILDAPTLKSVAQVEKLFSKEKKLELAKLVASVSSGTVLVEESDPRPCAVTGAAEDFKVITA